MLQCSNMNSYTHQVERWNDCGPHSPAADGAGTAWPGMLMYLETENDNILQASNTYTHLNICTEGKYKQGTSKLWTTGIVGWHRLTGGKRWCVLRLSDSIRAVTRLASRILAMLCSTRTESWLRVEMTRLRRWQADNNVLMNKHKHWNKMQFVNGSWTRCPSLILQIDWFILKYHTHRNDWRLEELFAAFPKKSTWTPMTNLTRWVVMSSGAKWSYYWREILTVTALYLFDRSLNMPNSGHLACWEGAAQSGWTCLAGM